MISHIKITFTGACTHDIHTFIPMYADNTHKHVRTNAYPIHPIAGQQNCFITYASHFVGSCVLGFINFTPSHLFLHSLQPISVPDRSVVVFRWCVRVYACGVRFFYFYMRKNIEHHVSLKSRFHAVCVSYDHQI